MRTKLLKTALWFLGVALALQITFVLVVSIPGIFDPQHQPANGWRHLVLWSMLCTLAVWGLMHHERRQQKVENQGH